MALALLSLLGSLLGPSSVARLPGIRYAVDVAVVTEADGSLTAIDAETYAIRDRVPAGAIDLLASRTTPGSLTALEPGDQGTGLAVEWAWGRGAFVARSYQPFAAEGGRLVDVNASVVGYAFDEGTTLFTSKDGVSTGVVEGIPSSAVAVAEDAESSDVYALEDDGTTFALRRSHAAPGALEDLGVAWSIPKSDGETAAVVNHLGHPALVTLTSKLMEAVADDGSVLASAKVKLPSAAIADAMSLGERGILVLTRPTAKLYVLTGQHAEPITLKSGGTITEAPWFSHRLAFDEARDRAWVATDAGLFRVQLGALTATKIEGTTATAVALLYAPED